MTPPPRPWPGAALAAVLARVAAGCRDKAGDPRTAVPDAS